MPFDVAVEEPRPRVIRDETDSYLVTASTDAYDVTANWVNEVIVRAASTADDIEVMLQDHLSHSARSYCDGLELTPCKWKGWLPPPGMTISMTWFAGRGMTLPDGSRSAGLVTPLRIWSMTGTFGEWYAVPLRVNCSCAAFCEEQW
jgi:hypothetical protein